MSVSTSINTALANFLRELGKSVATVDSYDEKTIYGGYCNTCSYEEQVLVVSYTTEDGSSEKYTINDTFAGVIRLLDDYS